MTDILCIDDEPEILDILRDTLEMNPEYQITTCISSKIKEEMTRQIKMIFWKNCTR